MIFLLHFLLVTLRITPLSQKNAFSLNKIVKSQAQKEKCVDKKNEEYSSGPHDNDEYFYCAGNLIKASSMKFNNCYFHDIKMTKSSTSMLIHTKYADLRIEYCTFKNIQYSDKMIYCDATSTYVFIYNNNYISNCNSLNSDARLIYTDNNNNEIKNNYIYFDPSISVGQAFYLEFIDNNRFINNTVINANCGHGSAIYSTSNDGKGDFIMEDCHFSNCRGTDGSIIYIDQLKNNLAIKNTIFENLQNYYQNNGDLIRLIGKNDNQELSFVDCKFRYLECDSKVGGGIGLFFYSKKKPKITFENTRFEHILHKHESTGGGAISIDQSNNNKDVGIIINNCIFKNVSDTNNGGAIYYNSNSNTISIRGSTFDQTSSSKDGNSIFIAQSNSYTVTIADCHFNDCGTQPNSYVININSQNFDFQDSEITFTESSKSCGCIKSNQYNEHNYLRNTFRNAHVDFPKNSAGIDESNSANSNKIHIIDNIFDGISGPSEGRCFYVNFASSDIVIDHNIIKNCPSGGILIKIELSTKFTTFEFKQYEFTNNFMSDVSFSEYQICPQIFVKNSMSGDFPDEIELLFSNCLFQNNFNSKKGGAISYGKNKNNAFTKMNFNNCQFRGNAADEGGSALSLIVYQGCQISNCQFIANKAEPGNGVIYVETDFECPSMSTKPTSSPQIDIDRCIFEDNKGKDAGIALSSSQNAPVSIKNCQFQNCGSSGHVIAIQSDVQSTIIQNCSISNTDSIYSGGIDVHSKGKIEIIFINFVLTSVDSALSIKSEESTEKVSVTQCLFDSCSGNSYSCFYISAKTNSFEFKDITVKNVKISGCDNYLGSLNLNGQIILTLTNISFTGVSCSSLYGGGTGMIFSGIPELIFDKCDFVNNEAHQDKSKSRPLANSDTIPYYNGDGGAIQIGCQAETAEMVLRFRDCNFRENKAFRHGGALAIQTIKELELYNCKLEQNIANYDFETSSSNLLFENYFHKKKDGRGGAIYLNPASGCVDSFTQNVIINDCELSWNKAYDGYAIYIEGDDPGTEFNIIKNNFNDNYDPNNHDSNDPNIIYGAVIATEIWSFTKDTLRPPGKPENNNYFSQSDSNLQINELYHVDHSGRTQTKAFTESDYFPTDSFSASISFSYSAYFTNSNEFSCSSPFSPSDHFPSSSYFTDSDQFSKSSQFSKSDAFSNSNLFTGSNHFTNSDHFSPSNQFSSSNKFSNSDPFTKTGEFSKTDLFSKSEHFSESAQFSKSSDFTDSDQFSNSNKFTNSDSFTKTDVFSKSDSFSKSEHFTESVQFSESSDLTKSDQFSNSIIFTNSDSFTNTGEFSKTDLFSKSAHFSESVQFSESSYFTDSDQFSNSNKFTNSDSFTKTSEFSKTDLFSQSEHFSESAQFSESSDFTKSDQFSNSNKFTNSDSFTKTGEFSKTDLFSKSEHFSKSTLFSDSFYFTKSDPFSNSNKFTNSDSFTKTGEFSKTEFFSESTHFSNSFSFSESSHFSYSKKFSNSDWFTKTVGFSKSAIFSETEHFSKSSLFSKSNKFSLSNEFTESKQFSKSSEFSNSDKFSNSNKFSESQSFSLTNLFSESSKFTLSDTFPPSNSFSESNKFSPTQYFSNSDKFSSSIKFTCSKLFSQSDDFSDSKSFSSSMSFSKSKRFSNSNQFTETQEFSFSVTFTVSNDFTVSHSFSYSKKFSDSLGFSGTSRFSLSDKFTYSIKFTISESFTISDKFTDSSAFSQSNSFKPTTDFSDSNEFSKTRKFSFSYQFSNSRKFSETQLFSKSDLFTSSMKFSSSRIFTPSSVFSNSNHFSQSKQFSLSAGFSHSNHFSPSIDFSPSIPPEISEPLCGVWENDVYTIYDDCDFVINDSKFVYIYVLATNFSDYKKEGKNGGAVHLINCGIHCNDTNFIDCVSLSGAGGGIYINSTLDMTNNATFSNVLFLRCKASYGGAVFIYTDSDLFNISFDGCRFESNEALKTKPSNSKNEYLFGGSAMFIMSNGFTIYNCSFTHNKGYGSVKIYNNFKKKSTLLQESQNSILIHCCDFDEEENSKGSINYIDEKSNANVDIVDCKFKGNIKKGSYYIDGKLNNIEKLHVASCNFKNDINNHVNVKLINNEIPFIVDKKDQSILHAKSMVVIFAMIIIFTLIIFILFYVDHRSNNSLDSLMILDNKSDDSLYFDESSSL